MPHRPVERFRPFLLRRQELLEPRLFLGLAWVLKGEEGDKKRAEREFTDLCALAPNRDQAALGIAQMYGYFFAYLLEDSLRWLNTMSDFKKILSKI